MKQSGITFKSKGLSIEGAIALPHDMPPPYPGVVVCHPHPLFGGDMENSVVIAICRTLGQHGIATLRFNFRGVGESEGVFSNGEEEQEDVKSALYVLRKWPGMDSKKLGLAGYSFGASVILGGVSKYKEAKAFALVAPPVSAVRNSPIRADKRPKLFLAGERDKIAPASELKTAVQGAKEPLEFHVLPKADHSLVGHESEAAKIIAEFFTEAMR